MKALPSRLPVLFCLCMVTALALAFSAPPAARAAGHLYIYGGGGGGGGGRNADKGGGGGGGASGAVDTYDGSSSYGGGGDGGSYDSGAKGGGTGGGRGGNNASPNGGNGTAPNSGGGGGFSGGTGGAGTYSGGKGGNAADGQAGDANTGNGGGGGGVGGGAGGSGLLTGGGGGANGAGGAGAGGVGTTFTYTISAGAAYDKLTMTGGQGGAGGDGGGDGGGGGGLGVTAGALVVGGVNISGGAGGKGGTSNSSESQGGAGGDVEMTLTDTLTVNGDMVISGGAGSAGGTGAHGGNGGAGARAAFSGASQDVSVAGALALRSGTKGHDDTGSGGAAGAASFTAATLRTGSIELTKNGGALTFQVNNALVWTGDGAFTLTGSGATVSINALEIDGGTVNSHNVENLINPSAFSYTHTDVTLGAGGATFDTGGGDQNVDRKLIGSGGLTKTGAGTLTLAGANTYTGMTTVRQGVLALGADHALGSKNLSLYGGAGFDRGAYAHSLDGGSLTVNGVHASWRGDLDATNATLNFIAPAGLGSGQTMLDVSGSADITGSAVNVGVSGGTSLPGGTKLSLLQAANGLTADSKIVQGSGIVESGVTTIYNIDLSADANTLYGTVTGGSATKQAKALSEGWLGGMALNLQGADLIAGRGMESASQAANDAGATGFAGFGALSGGSLRYNTGSHVDMRSLSLLTGLARGADLTPGRLTVGAFFEYGNGSYNTHNSFSNAADVDGDGNTYYLGGGILARMDFSKTGPGRFHAEASARAGKTHNEYDSSDLRDASGRKAEYDSDTPYYGLHFGAGYLWEINDKASLDLYGKYFWTRQQGDSLSLSTGERLSFDDADSSRLRLGGRLAYVLNEHVAPYVGAAWEHEFDGKARATTNGFDIDAPSLRGDTGIGELGLSLTPSASLPLTLDLGVQGYVGQRQGVTGSLQVKYEF